MPSYKKELFGYPKFHVSDDDYREYWRARSMTPRSFNSFQKKRAAMTLARVEPDSVLLDIGVGNGQILAYINERKSMRKLIGADISSDALAMAKENGVETIQVDITDPEQLKGLPPADYIFFFEVLEHMANSEEVLKWATGHAAKGVFFSVPNTGYFIHRLRLLMGRFPLQWRVRPSEHLRFWTVRDMRWWLSQLGYHDYTLKLYEGPRLLNILWPSLFAAGMWAFIPTRR